MIPRMRWLFQKAITNNLNSKTTSTRIRGTAIFSGSKTGDFVQDSPVLANQYEDDPLLDKYLKFALPEEVKATFFC